VSDLRGGQDPGLTTHRIEALTDGVFAIAMTLLVLTLEIPEAGQNIALHQILFGQAHKFFNYALSFILLAIFWIVHHQQYHPVKRTNRVHLWMSIFILMFVALIPFSTTLIGDYPDQPIADVFFGLNMFMVGFLFLLSWLYATTNFRLIDKDYDPKRIILGTKRSLVVPAVSLLSIICAFVLPSISSHVYLLIPIIMAFPQFKYRSAKNRV